ncbi:MAG TPA: SRPBCC family protein [Terriglobales bacterium]|nr:SRPBCC family protein [Terriglobales bacterium]
MARRRQWNGFMAGAVTGVAAAFAALALINTAGRARHSQIVRLQKSLQIGRPVEEVFNSWADLDTLARCSPMIHSVRRQGSQSHWVVEIEGRRFEWDAEVEQFIPNQAIGWKSSSGPKHTGRITFSPLGDNTQVNVTMNYAPRRALLRPFVRSMSGRIENHIEQALRDFKAALENKGQEQTIRSGSAATRLDPTASSSRATGTFGAVSEGIGQTQHTRFSGPSDYTSPPEKKS